VQLVSRRLENDSLSFCSGKRGAKRGGAAAAAAAKRQGATVKKASTLDEWLGMPLSNETGRNAELSTDWRRLLQPKTTSFC
jgi:hypothetical protein